MNKRSLKIATTLIVFTMCLTSLNVVKADTSTPSAFTGTSVTKRITGSNPLEISVHTSQAGWNKSDCVIIASSADFPDALSGTTLGIQINAPILFTDGNLLDRASDGSTVDGNVLCEIKRLGAKTAYILGGEGSVSSTVENTLKSRGLQTLRLYGNDRFETAIAVGQEVIKKSKSNTAFICNAYGFADALAGSVFAGKSGNPILLTDAANLNEDTKKALADWGIKNVYILGGQGVISSSVESEISAMSISVNRIGGIDRYDTAKAIIDKFSSLPQFLTVATGKDYHNALVASVYASKENAPLMLFDSDCSSTTKDFLNNKSLTAVGNDDLGLNSYDFSDLPSSGIPAVIEVIYDKSTFSGQTGAALFNYNLMSDSQKHGGLTSMAYFDLTTGELSGINVDTPVSTGTGYTLMSNLYIYYQRSKGLMNGNDQVSYKRTSTGATMIKTLAQVQKMILVDSDADAMEAIDPLIKGDNFNAFVGSIVGNQNGGYTPKQMIQIMARVYAFINTNTDLAREFKANLQDQTVGDMLSQANLPNNTEVIHRAYTELNYGVNGDCMIVLGAHPYVMFIQYNSKDASNNRWLGGYVKDVYNHVNGSSK